MALEWSELGRQPLPWANKGKGSSGEFPFVILTRLLTYRNFSNSPFMVSAPPNICHAIAERALHMLTKQGRYQIQRLSETSVPRIRLLRERHLIPERFVPMPGKKETKYLAISNLGQSWALVNEVEHFTFGQIFPGQLLETDLVSHYQIPEEHSPISPPSLEHAPWAWSPYFGYLTSLPNRIGLGLEIELLVHLPGLALAHQLQQARNAMVASGLSFLPVQQIGSTPAEIGLFVLKSRGSAGQTLSTHYQEFLGIVKPLLDWERQLQNRCLEKHPKRLEERVKVAFQDLVEAQTLSYSDLLTKASYLRLGAYLDILDPQIAVIMEELRIRAGSGHLGVSSEQNLSKEEEDITRANGVRLALEGLRV